MNAPPILNRSPSLKTIAYPRSRRGVGRREVVAVLAGAIVVVCVTAVVWQMLIQPPTQPVHEPAAEQLPKASDPTPEPISQPPLAAKEDSAEQEAKRIYSRLLKSAALILGRGPGGTFQGTGSLVEKHQRLILTSYHLVGDADEAVVFFPRYRNNKLVVDRSEYLEAFRRKEGYAGKVVARDSRRGLALIQLKVLPDEIEPLPFVNKNPKPGEMVHVIGNPGLSDNVWVYWCEAVREVGARSWQVRLGGDILPLEAKVVATQSPSPFSSGGAPLVNDAVQLVAVMEGGSISPNGGPRLLTCSIDVSEVKLLLERYARTYDLTLKLKTSDGTEIELNGAKPRVPLGKDAVPYLIEVLKDDDPNIRSAAAKALGQIGREAKTAQKLLQELSAKDPSPNVRQAAEQALKQLGN